METFLRANKVSRVRGKKLYTSTDFFSPRLFTKNELMVQPFEHNEDELMINETEGEKNMCACQREASRWVE